MKRCQEVGFLESRVWDFGVKHRLILCESSEDGPRPESLVFAGFRV